MRVLPRAAESARLSNGISGEDLGVAALALAAYICCRRLRESFRASVDR
jgi:hypothetical protein